jgi:exosome complex component RRP45
VSVDGGEGSRPTAMARDDLLISTNEREFILRALRENELRVDGRGPLDVRRTAYRFGPRDGQCEVTLGQTRVLAVVSATLEQPSGGRSNEGSVSINVEFSPMASPNFEPGRPGEEASEVAVVLERAIRETGAVDVESLCVLAGKHVWHVRCDVHVLDACGNVVGASSLAAAAALLSFRRPEATVSPETRRVVVHPAATREPVALALRHLPVAVTFGFFEETDGLLILDPTVKEEAVSGGEMVVVLNARDELCAVHKGGGCAVAPGEIMRCVRLASRVAKEAVAELKRAHAAWEETRNKRRVRRHYGAEAAAAATAANPDFGLPGRKDHLRETGEPRAGAAGAADAGPLDDAEGKSDSEEDHMGEGSADDAEEHVPLGVMAPASESEEEPEPERQTANGKRAAAADDDDVLGAFDEAEKRAGSKKKKKKKAGWDDLPGDGDDLAAAIKSKVDKKRGAKTKGKKR